MNIWHGTPRCVGNSIYKKDASSGLCQFKRHHKMFQWHWNIQRLFQLSLSIKSVSNWMQKKSKWEVFFCCKIQLLEVIPPAPLPPPPLWSKKTDVMVLTPVMVLACALVLPVLWCYIMVLARVIVLAPVMVLTCVLVLSRVYSVSPCYGVNQC